jgi:hypothetical protein
VRLPLCLLHALLSPSHHGLCSYPHQLSTVGINHTRVIGAPKVADTATNQAENEFIAPTALLSASAS